MRKSAARILEGFCQALSFSRGECKHDWEEVIVHNYGKANHISRVRKCRKCGVRLTEFESHQIKV